LHDVGELHETPLNSFAPFPKFGLETTTHSNPFQDSTKVLLVELVKYPTAVQFDEDVQETLERSLMLEPGLGLRTTLQLPPLHDSIRVLGVDVETS
jgi:hypothetical protein